MLRQLLAYPESTEAITLGSREAETLMDEVTTADRGLVAIGPEALMNANRTHIQNGVFVDKRQDDAWVVTSDSLDRPTYRTREEACAAAWQIVAQGCRRERRTKANDLLSCASYVLFAVAVVVGLMAAVLFSALNPIAGSVGVVTAALGWFCRRQPFLS